MWRNMKAFKSFNALILSQVVPSESQENGQTNVEEEMEKTEDEKQPKTPREKKSSVSEETSETQITVSLDGEAKKGKLLEASAD